MEDSSLVHLHRHSDFSLLDGTGSAQQYAERAAELGQNALALTDHGTLGGTLHHIAACREVGIKPILGMEAYFRWDRLNKDPTNKKRYHLVLLAKNLVGFHNLIRMSSEAHRSGWWNGADRPCIDWSLLERYRDGLMASSACMSSQLSYLILEEDDRRAEKWIARMKRIFGDDFAMEIMPGPGPQQEKINLALADLSQTHSIPLIATCDAHYPYKDWCSTQDVLLMCNTGQTLSKRVAKRESGEDVYSMVGVDTLYLMGANEMAGRFAINHPLLRSGIVKTAIANTSAWASKIEDIDLDRSRKLPRVGDNAEVTLMQWVYEGLRRIKKSTDQVYLDRIKYEMDVFRGNGVIDYFVILGDAVRWARDKGIRVGIGRGSAAASLVSYLVRITGIDPIAHGLLFERFMNPGRKIMPDIDVDFQHDRRHEIVDYLYTKYGRDHVVSVSAYQKFGLRSALADVARVHDVPFDVVHKITKRLDDDKGSLTLEDVRKIDKGLDRFATQFPEVWKHAIRLEGSHKTLSKHPAGVVVTDKPVEEYMPMIRGKDGDLITAWSESKDQPTISNYGLLKMDFLSTDSLTIQEYCLNLIEKRHGKRPDIDNLSIMTDPNSGDPKVLEAFGRRQTLGVFQFSSSGLSALLKKIAPDRFADLVAANALYRPGPLQGGMTASYHERKHGREPITEWHPSVHDSLEITYGLMVYQEQVMKVVELIGGFSPSESDDVRSAVGKKVVAKMKGYKKQFIDGAVKNGLVRDQAKDIWDKIVFFAGYGFNLAHASGYAAQAYQDMWLKVYYPLEFYASVATYEIDKIAPLVREARAMNVPFLPPDVNKSGGGFTVDGDYLRFGLGGIKHVGAQAAAVIMEHRPYTSYEDFEARVPRRAVNSRVRTVLASVGAFNSIGGHPEQPHSPSSEKEYLGVSLTSVDDIVSHRSIFVERLVSEEDLDQTQDGEFVIVGGEIVAIKEIVTRKGASMAFIDLYFEGDAYSVTVFPKQWWALRDKLTIGVAILVWGKKDEARSCVLMDKMVTMSDLLDEIQNRSSDGASES